MNPTWQKLSQRFHALSPRERLMVFAAGVALIIGLAFLGWIDGAMTRQKDLAKANEAKVRDLANLKSRVAELERVLASDPNAEGRTRIEALRKQLGTYDSDLKGVQRGLVPPSRMAKVLEDMLARETRVRLVRLHTLPVSGLVDPAVPAATQPGTTAPAPGTAPPARAGSLVYKHGLELTVEGNYLDLLEYQARLEKLPWKMFFQKTSIDSKAYPKVYMTLTVYTLSLEEAWLVV